MKPIVKWVGRCVLNLLEGVRWPHALGFIGCVSNLGLEGMTGLHWSLGIGFGLGTGW